MNKRKKIFIVILLIALIGLMAWLLFLRENKESDYSYVLNCGRSTDDFRPTDYFCERDVPVLARLVCSLSMGEYRKDIQAFLNGQYINPESERFT